MAVVLKNIDNVKTTINLVKNNTFETISIIRKKADVFYVPFAEALKNNCLEALNYESQNCKFKGVLREEQKLIVNEALNILKLKKCLIISCYTGFGKTISASYLANILNLKTLIIVPKLILLEQWKTSLKEMFDVDVSIITSKTTVVDNDFSVINCLNIHKIDKSILQSFGTIIVDEVHLILAKKLFTNLLHLTPRYLVGLSATSYRSDGLNSLFEIFFGNSRIYKPLNKTHLIYKINTNFSPTIKYNFRGQVDWNNILEQQSSSTKRNDLIVQLILSNTDRNILVLVKRIVQANYIYEALLAKDVNVDTLFGKKKIFDKNCRVLIGTNSKIGTGFDFAKLNMLILAADVVEYYIQFIGRVMRTDTIPLIYDLVDNNPIMESHFKKRLQIYLKHGGVLHHFRNKVNETLYC